MNITAAIRVGIRIVTTLSIPNIEERLQSNEIQASNGNPLPYQVLKYFLGKKEDIYYRYIYTGKWFYLPI